MPEDTEVRFLDKPIAKSELKQIAEKRFGDLVKAVVDIEKEIMVIGGELHSDEEAYLLARDSQQENLWGINVYPDESRDWIEFDSMINIKPRQGNRSRSIEDVGIQEKIIKIVNNLIV